MGASGGVSDPHHDISHSVFEWMTSRPSIRRYDCESDNPSVSSGYTGLKTCEHFSFTICSVNLKRSCYSTSKIYNGCSELTTLRSPICICPGFGSYQNSHYLVHWKIAVAIFFEKARNFHPNCQRLSWLALGWVYDFREAGIHSW